MFSVYQPHKLNNMQTILSLEQKITPILTRFESDIESTGCCTNILTIYNAQQDNDSFIDKFLASYNIPNQDNEVVNN